MQATKISSPGYKAFGAFVILIFIAATLGGHFNRAAPADERWLAWPIFIALLAMLVRSPFVGLVVRDGRVTRRSWFRNQSWPVTEIVKVTTPGYSGFIYDYWPSRRIRMLKLRLNDGTKVGVPEVAGTRARTEQRAESLRIALSAGPQ